MKKVTKMWTMKDKTKIRICDMEDSHLLNCIRMLHRATNYKASRPIMDGYSALASLNGEQAIYCVEAGLNDLEENGLDPSTEYPIYDSLCDEAIRRKLELPKYEGV